MSGKNTFQRDVSQIFRETDVDLNLSENFLKRIVFFFVATVYSSACSFHGNNHKLDALFSYNGMMLNRPADSYFTRKFSNCFAVKDIGLWHIRSSFCLVKHFKTSSSLLSFSFRPSGNRRLYASLQLMVNKAKLILIAYFTH